MSEQVLVFSYERFSDAVQSKGDSIRRQDSLARRWALRAGLPFDERRTLRDCAASAYHGVHRSDPDRYALAAFLQLVADGDVPRGSYLVIENLDRLSREKPTVSMTLLLNLLSNGIRVVVLTPVEVVYDEDTGGMQLMLALMEMSRAHGESQVKSIRVGEWWEKTRREAREGKRHGGNLPAWIRKDADGTGWEVIPEHCDTIRLVFKLAAAGEGALSIARRLTREKHPTFSGGRKKRRASAWGADYVRRLLTDRRVTGEYTFKTGHDHEAEGEPIPDYYPRVIDEDTWSVVENARRTARRVRSRERKNVNTFVGILSSAIDGSGMILARSNSTLVIDSYQGRRGSGSARCFPYEVLEEGVLRTLREIEVEGFSDSDDADSVRAAETDVGEARAQIAFLLAELGKGGSPTLTQAVRMWEAKLADAEDRLRVARDRRATPVSAAWSDARTLAASMRDAPDRNALRVRIRSALRRVGASGHVLICGKGKTRLAAVQLRLKELNVVRSFLIYYKAAGNGRQAAAMIWSRIDAEVPLDLSRRDDALALEAELGRVDWAVMEQQMKPLDGSSGTVAGGE